MSLAHQRRRETVTIIRWTSGIDHISCDCRVVDLWRASLLCFAFMWKSALCSQVSRVIGKFTALAILPPLALIAHDHETNFLFPVVSTMVRCGVLHSVKNLHNITLIIVSKKCLACLIKCSALKYTFCIFSGHWYLPQERPKGPSYWAQVARYLSATACEGKFSSFFPFVFDILTRAA